MNVQVAGISIDVGGIVWLFNVWGSWPVYHRAGFEGEVGAMQLVTGCGRPIDRPNYASAIALPPKHAARIGRPCATCWPELRNRESLFKRRPGPGATRSTQEEIHA